MKYALLLTLLTIFALINCTAQEMVCVVDDVSHEPIGHVYFIQEGDTIAYTTPQGIAILPQIHGKLQIVCRDYKKITICADSIPGVIHLKSELEQLDEIQIIGDKNKIKRKKEKWDDNENAFKARKPRDWLGEGGIGIGIDAIFRLCGYKPASERKRKRVKKILDAYDQPTPPANSSHTH